MGKNAKNNEIKLSCSNRGDCICKWCQRKRGCFRCIECERQQNYKPKEEYCESILPKRSPFDDIPQ